MSSPEGLGDVSKNRSKTSGCDGTGTVQDDLSNERAFDWDSCEYGDGCRGSGAGDDVRRVGGVGRVAVDRGGEGVGRGEEGEALAPPQTEPRRGDTRYKREICKTDDKSDSYPTPPKLTPRERRQPERPRGDSDAPRVLAPKATARPQTPEEPAPWIPKGVYGPWAAPNTISLRGAIIPEALPPEALSGAARLHRARRVQGCPQAIAKCGRWAHHGLPQALQVEAPGAAPSGDVSGLATCGSRGCPVCGPIEAKKAADRLARALSVLTPEGWQLGLATLTIPHRLHTPVPALVAAISKGMSAVGRLLKTYATDDAKDARSQLHDRWANTLTPAQKDLLRERVLLGSLGYLAPHPEVTVGANGLHPHCHILLMCPPALTRETWWVRGWQEPAPEGKRSKTYLHLGELEASLYGAWSDATLSALNRSARSYSYFPPDHGLKLELDRAGARLDEVLREQEKEETDQEKNKKNVAAARVDLSAALRDFSDSSPKRLALRRRTAQVIKWRGPVGAIAHYAWGAASEVHNEGRKTNNLWRSLDSDFTAPLWGKWVEAARSVRLTRTSSGLKNLIKQAAEQAEATPAPGDVSGLAAVAAAPKKYVVADVHTRVTQWLQDQKKTQQFREATAKGAAELRRWCELNLPPVLRPLLHYRTERVTPEDDDRSALSKIRHELAVRGLELGASGYWIGPDGHPATPDTEQPAPGADARIAERRAELLAPHPWQRMELLRGVNALAVATATTPSQARSHRARARDAVAVTLTGTPGAYMAAYTLADAVARAENLMEALNA